MKLKQSSGRVNQRRIDAKERLEYQLKVGTKPACSTKNAIVEFASTDPLTEDDIKRIEKEVSTLISKLLLQDIANARRTKIYRGPK